MQIREFGKPITSKTLNESLAKRYGQRINLEKFTLEQLQDARNKIRTKISQVEMSESFSSVIENESYQRSKLMLDILNAAISERGDISDDLNDRKLKEGAEDHAELVMAAKEMVDRITGWMEDTAEMQTESMLELADAIRDEMGTEAADAFTNAVKPALDSLFGTLESTRTALTQGVGQLTGEAEPTDTIGADDMSMEPTVDGDMDAGTDDMDMDAGDEFGAAEPATGGEEGADRAKRESREFAEKKSYSAKKAAAGKDIGKPGKNFAKIAKSAGEKYGSKERGEKVAGAVLKKLRTKESVDPSMLYSLLSKKK